MSRAALALLGLIVAAPAFAGDPPSVYLERQQPAEPALATSSAQKKPKATCRVVQEWKVGEVVAQHRICDDPPAPKAAVQVDTLPVAQR